MRHRLPPVRSLVVPAPPPSAEAFCTFRVPELTSTSPLSPLLLPASTRLPGPNFTKPELPEIEEAILELLEPE